jgi:hypothetical protein
MGGTIFAKDQKAVFTFDYAFCKEKAKGFGNSKLFLKKI